MQNFVITVEDGKSTELGDVDVSLDALLLSDSETAGFAGDITASQLNGICTGDQDASGNIDASSYTCATETSWEHSVMTTVLQEGEADTDSTEPSCSSDAFDIKPAQSSYTDYPVEYTGCYASGNSAQEIYLQVQYDDTDESSSGQTLELPDTSGDSGGEESDGPEQPEEPSSQQPITANIQPQAPSPDQSVTVRYRMIERLADEGVQVSVTPPSGGEHSSMTLSQTEGSFTLQPPENGWASGEWQIELSTSSGILEELLSSGATLTEGFSIGSIQESDASSWREYCRGQGYGGEESAMTVENAQSCIEDDIAPMCFSGSNPESCTSISQQLCSDLYNRDYSRGQGRCVAE